MTDIETLAEEQGVEPFDPDTFEPLPPLTPKETQQTLLALWRDDLVSKGWTLVRDNQDGGALVLEGDGVRVVASLHTHQIKDRPAITLDIQEAEEAPCSTATSAETPEDGPQTSPAPEGPAKSVES